MKQTVPKIHKGIEPAECSLNEKNKRSRLITVRFYPCLNECYHSKRTDSFSNVSFSSAHTVSATLRVDSGWHLYAAGCDSFQAISTTDGPCSGFHSIKFQRNISSSSCRFTISRMLCQHVLHGFFFFSSSYL